MTITTPERSTFTTRESAEAELLQRFKLLLARAPVSVLLKAVTLKDDRAVVELAKAKLNAERSMETRNQQAKARMKARSFARIQERCELLESREAYEILGITKQALSQKTLGGQLLVYTNTGNRRKFYPAFQFAKNKVRPVIARLISELEIDPADMEAMNFLVQHLVSKMDYSDLSESSKVTQRYELLDDEAALEIIKRDYRNAFEPGQ